MPGTGSQVSGNVDFRGQVVLPEASVHGELRTGLEEVHVPILSLDRLDPQFLELGFKAKASEYQPGVVGFIPREPGAAPGAAWWSLPRSTTPRTATTFGAGPA